MKCNLKITKLILGLKASHHILISVRHSLHCYSDHTEVHSGTELYWVWLAMWVSSFNASVTMSEWAFKVPFYAQFILPICSSDHPSLWPVCVGRVCLIDLAKRVLLKVPSMSSQRAIMLQKPMLFTYLFILQWALDIFSRRHWSSRWKIMI